MVLAAKLIVAVAPVLKFGNWENRYMYGQVKTTFANSQYLEPTCKTPIQVESWDPDYQELYVGGTCMTISSAAQSFSTYDQYMASWSDLINSGNGTTDQKYRPAPVALFLQNTTVNGTWIDIIDTAAVSKAANRVINNVTLAMPHTGVFQAARDPLSGILQPEVYTRTALSNADIRRHLTAWACTRSGPPFRARISMCFAQTWGRTRLRLSCTRHR